MNTTKIPAFIINTTYRVHSDDVEAFAALTARMAINARKREGCVFLHAAQSVLDSKTFHLFEAWSTQDAFDSHIASEDFQAVLQDVMRLRITERFGDIILVSGVKPLEMPS